jgi:hypothetical protein
LNVLGGGCCSPSQDAADGGSIHQELGTLLRRYDVNEFAASVKVFAVKPPQKK